MQYVMPMRLNPCFPFSSPLSQHDNETECNANAAYANIGSNLQTLDLGISLLIGLIIPYRKRIVHPKSRQNGPFLADYQYKLLS